MRTRCRPLSSHEFRAGANYTGYGDVPMTPLRDETFVRKNGERVAFSEYGEPNGEPVMFCHGWPSSRTMGELTHEAAQQTGVRILSPDRPGIRGSSFRPNRKLLDWPPLVQRLVDGLDIGEFRVLAVSGGAPYAYATARAMPTTDASVRRGFRNRSRRLYLSKQGS